MLKDVDRTEKQFKNKYFIFPNFHGFLNENLGKDIYVNFETPPVSGSIFVYCDDLSEDELLHFMNEYLAEREIESLSVLPTLTEDDFDVDIYEKSQSNLLFDPDTSLGVFFDKLGKTNSLIWKVV